MGVFSYIAIQDLFFSLSPPGFSGSPVFSFGLQHSFIHIFWGKFISLTAAFLLPALRDAPVTLRAPLEVR